MYLLCVMHLLTNASIYKAFQQAIIFKYEIIINKGNYQTKAGICVLPGQANLVNTSQEDIVPKLAHTY